MKRPCFISGMETDRNFENVPVHKEVLDFARRYRDALSTPQKKLNLRGILSAFQAMKGFGHTWPTIQKKLIDELKDKNITF